MQHVSITNKVVNGELYPIHHYGIKLDGDLHILVVFFKYCYLLQGDDFFFGITTFCDKIYQSLGVGEWFL